MIFIQGNSRLVVKVTRQLEHQIETAAQLTATRTFNECGIADNYVCTRCPMYAKYKGAYSETREDEQLYQPSKVGLMWFRDGFT